MREFVYKSVTGKLHFSLRTRGPQSVDALAYWLRLPCREVFRAVQSDDRIGWAGCPESDPAGVVCRLVTKEFCRLPIDRQA